MKKHKKATTPSRKIVGMPTKQIVAKIPDTPENVAKALFGIRPDGKKVKTMKP